MEQACHQLLERLASRGIPLTLISQYLPVQYAAIRAGRLKNAPRELVLHGVEQVLRHYDGACRPAVRPSVPLLIEELNELSWAPAGRIRGGTRNLDRARNLAAAGRLGEDCAAMGGAASATQAFLAPLLERRDLRIVLTGAGTSAFIGECLAAPMRRTTQLRVDAVATTDLVGYPASYLDRSAPTVWFRSRARATVRRAWRQ